MAWLKEKVPGERQCLLQSRGIGVFGDSAQKTGVAPDDQHSNKTEIETSDMGIFNVLLTALATSWWPTCRNNHETSPPPES